jgi:hypothetical protein
VVDSFVERVRGWRNTTNADLLDFSILGFVMAEKSSVIIKAFPPPEEYEGAEREFLQALGLCVSQWAFVDRQLFRLFRFCLQTATHRAAVVYYSQRTLGQHVRAVDQLLKESLTPTHYETDWRPLRGRFEELIAVRNIFAHQPTRRLHTAKNGKPVYEYAIHIEPYERLLNRKLRGLKDKDHIDVDDLKKHAEAVHELERDFIGLVKKLST